MEVLARAAHDVQVGRLVYRPVPVAADVRGKVDHDRVHRESWGGGAGGWYRLDRSRVGGSFREEGLHGDQRDLRHAGLVQREDHILRTGSHHVQVDGQSDRGDVGLVRQCPHLGIADLDDLLQSPDGDPRGGDQIRRIVVGVSSPQGLVRTMDVAGRIGPGNHGQILRDRARHPSASPCSIRL